MRRPTPATNFADDPQKVAPRLNALWSRRVPETLDKQTRWCLIKISVRGSFKQRLDRAIAGHFINDPSGETLQSLLIEENLSVRTWFAHRR